MPEEIVQKINQESDLDKLIEITREMLGEPCWQASLSYGDELCLDVGEKIPYSHKKMVGFYTGSWMFGTRGTEWRLESPSGIITTSAEEPEIFKQKVKAVEGTTITAFETSYPDLVLTVGFSNGCKLLVFPDLADDFDLSYWELFTPHNMLLTLEPGGIWTYTRSDVPMGAKPTLQA